MRTLSEGETKRLANLKDMLAARTGPDGKPKPGYAGNVKSLQFNIETLEQLGTPKVLKLKHA